MILTERVLVKEVKKGFLLANAFKKIAERHHELSRVELEEHYEQLQKEFEELEEQNLDEQITDKKRLQRYNSMDWYRGEKTLESMGVWPKMRGLDILLTVGSVLDTAKGIEKVKQNESSLYVSEKFLKKLDSFRELSEFIYPRFPLILFPGGEVRDKDYNNWVREHREPFCSIFDYDIDDGCIRSVAYAFENFKQAPVYFSKYKN